MEPILDFRKALDNEVLVHPEENWKSYGNTGDVKRNLLHHEEDTHGDVEQILSECEEVIEHSWRIKAAQQGYMETIRAYCEIDRYGRLHCISSTQIVFHVRRIIANALGPKIDGACGKTAYRRRIRSKTDSCLRSLSGICDLDDKETV